MKTRYAITHISKDGLRVLSFPNQGRNHFDTQAEADKFLAALLDPATNRPHVLRSVYGPHYLETIRAQPVPCFDHGDATKTVFEYLARYDNTTPPGECKALARLGVPKVPPGYTADELERDNPYNAWIP